MIKMPHRRDRFLSEWIKKLVKSTPALGLIGMRQTGKTTLLGGLAKTVYRFDQEANLRRFERESEALLRVGPFPILLDEVQKYPSVFDEVKGLIDEKKIPGRFLMTGSVRFSLKKQIRESMTGRMILLELLPLGLAEAHQRSLSDAIPRILKKMGHEEKLLDELSGRQWVTPKEAEHFLETGGLPGICFNRDVVMRTELMEAHLDTLLGRDLRQVYNSKLSANRLRDFLRLLALTAGQPINKSYLARELATTVPTIGAHLLAFEALFLIRPLGQGYYIEDQGLASHLCRFDRQSALSRLRRQIFAELQQQAHYRFRAEAQLSTYTSTSGNSIPFVLKFASGQVLGLIVDEGDRASNSSLKTATWFRKKHGTSSACLILHEGREGAVVNKKVLSIPYTWVF